MSPENGSKMREIINKIENDPEVIKAERVKKQKIQEFKKSLYLVEGIEAAVASEGEDRENVDTTKQTSPEEMIIREFPVKPDRIERQNNTTFLKKKLRQEERIKRAEVEEKKGLEKKKKGDWVRRNKKNN